MLITFTRIFYTGTLLVFGLGLIPYYVLMSSSADAGHGTFSIFSPEAIFPIVLLSPLLAARLLFHRSPKWLLLGLPSILAIYGFVVYLFGMSFFVQY